MWASIVIGPWRVIPGRQLRKGVKPYWMVGRDEAGGIRFVLTDYNQVPRRWKSEQGARDACAYWIGLTRAADRATRLAAEREALRAGAPPDWPFPVSCHNWST
ncbi:MAG: hypothetical protein JWQ03_608 [Variovorax sp.]|nr:hypothetical protein [Variovorax sp.]